MNRRTGCLIVAFLLSSLPAQAQNVNLDERAKSLSSVGGKTDAEYRLGAGDLIEVSVFGVETFRNTLRISASGTIKLPLLDPVVAAGLTPAELEQRLTKLLDGEVIKNPQVSVFVKEYRSQSVYVLGSVNKPGQYQIALQLKIVDVIAMAGGLNSNAVDEAVIQRGAAENAEEIKVNLRELLEKGDLTQNVVVHGGDVVHIQERVAQTVYVIGDVMHAGAFGMTARQTLRVTQAFAYAGGPTRTAKLSKGMLIRYTADGARQELPVDFGEILHGRKEDFVLKGNDVIYVPGSGAKAFGYAVLSDLAMTLPYRIIP
jgi:polysaccharide export outer membrane protein